MRLVCHFGEREIALAFRQSNHLVCHFDEGEISATIVHTADNLCRVTCGDFSFVEMTRLRKYYYK